ncbi:hypothetical protein [Variovorax sp. PBL-E5]|uniref:hypothetical protein n=1 Tax=Variovorax sp. PBL-E5 TaxID=434014 RepID=UPI0013A58550|nr:hypothetical protein [Variovorax sp. PBL-E5]
MNKPKGAPSFAQLLAGDTSFLQCTRCGNTGECACWEKCSCGWTAEAGMPCRNPATTNCSTKAKYRRNGPNSSTPPAMRAASEHAPAGAPHPEMPAQPPRKNHG